MLKPQKKLTKKEIKEDKFVQFTMQAKAFAEDNARMLSIVTTAVVVIIAVFFIYMHFHNQTIRKASTLLGEAQLEYQNLNISKAKTLLTRLIDEYDGTRPALQGKFLLANIYFQENNTRKAEETYLDFINSYSGSPILLASGYAGYAACLERDHKYLEAARFYKKAREAAPDFVEAADYLYLAALNEISAQAYDQAKATLNKIISDYKDSSRKNDAEAQLILLAGN